LQFGKPELFNPVLLHCRKKTTQSSKIGISAGHPPEPPHMRRNGNNTMNDTTMPLASKEASPPQASVPKRRPLRPIVLGAVAIIVLGYGVSWTYEWWTHGRFIVSTDDAYVGAPISTISTRVSGHIIEIAVANNQAVHAGDLLVKIDDGDYRLAVESAGERIDTQTASLSRIDKQIAQQSAVIDQARAQITAAKADAMRAELDYARAQKLAEADFNTRARLDQVLADRDRTAAALVSATAGLAAAEAGIEVLKAQKVELEHAKAELETALAKARRDLEFTEIRAPFNGIVGNRAAQLGMLVEPGVRLLALVPLDAVYVDANFKETQLGRIKPGMTASVHADAWPGRTFVGKVTSFAPATGAIFSLLPPENATGNFTKIVQRIPVRITFSADDLKEMALRPGLSVIADIDTSTQ
jgi:membrane fusion protein (multidrug efflux system)